MNLIIKYSKQMKLSNKAIKALTVRARNRIALALDCSVQSVDRWIKENESNGNMTKAQVLQIINEETGLSDQEILEEITVEQQ